MTDLSHILTIVEMNHLIHKIILEHTLQNLSLGVCLAPRWRFHDKPMKFWSEIIWTKDWDKIQHILVFLTQSEKHCSE